MIICIRLIVQFRFFIFTEKNVNVLFIGLLYYVILISYILYLACMNFRNKNIFKICLFHGYEKDTSFDYVYKTT